MVTLASFAFPICSLGVNIGGRVHLVAPKDPVSLGEYLGLCLVLSVGDLLICVAAGMLLLRPAGINAGPLELGLFGLMGGFFLLQKLLNDGLIAYGVPVKAALIEFASSFSLLVSAGALALSGSNDVRLYVAAFIVTDLLQAAVAMRILGKIQPIRPTSSMVSWSRLVRTGLPGVGFTMSQLLTFRIDRYLVGIFGTPAAVGIYSVAATPPELVRLIPSALAQSVFHRLASDSAKVQDFKRATNLCILVTLGLVAIGFVAAPLAVHVVFGPKFASAVTPLRILLLGEIGMALFSVNGAALMGKRRIPDMAIIAVIGFVLVLVADLLLIPKYGLEGAAWASVVAYSVIGIATLLLLNRRV